MDNVKEKMDIFFDKNAPSIVVNISEYREGYRGIRKRGGKIRAFTEITKDNIPYCKELLILVDELRHLDGVRGGIAISETEYMATTVLQEKTPLTQVIYSNVKEVVEQGQYIFDTFWETAIPADQKIKEIEEGTELIKTEILENPKRITRQIIDLVNKSESVYICTAVGGMFLIYNHFFEEYKKILEKHRKGEHEGIRWITSINKEDTEMVKLFINEGINVRHVKDIPFLNFALSDKLLNSTIEKMEEGKMVTSLLSSNDKLYLNHYKAIFEELWKKGIDAKNRIRDIEEGNYFNVNILPNPKEALLSVSELVKLTESEILVIFSSSRGLVRTEKIGGISELDKLARTKRVKVKGLIPLDIAFQDEINKIKSNYPGIDFRSLQFPLPTLTGIIVVDRKETLIFEIKNDEVNDTIDAIGSMIHIEGKSTSLSYAAIFDSLWTQIEMYEKLQIHDRMQKEFINTAAHELRTPIQPILGLSEIAKSEIKDNIRVKEFLTIINRNAKRLHRLAEDILDITRMENNSLDLVKEHFPINEAISHIISDYNRNTDGKDIQFTFEIPDSLAVYADRNRINQVITNLIDNSIKFSPYKGLISIRCKKVIDNTDENNNEKVVVSVKDRGIGIDSKVYDRLFTKFTTNSFQGIGLGLYISKKIVEAHGGHMWAENNKDGKGATFSFTLPINK